MKRVIIHWTAGSHTPNSIDLKAYHYVIDGAGKVHHGAFPVSANTGRLVSGRYAAHTLNCNTDSIGVSLAAMAGAVERPFNAGRYPITEAQMTALARLVQDLCREYGIPITRQTVLTHAEVQPTLGIAQKQKWDITWIPGMSAPGDAVKVGDIIRSRISGAPLTRPAPQVNETPKSEHEPPRPSFWAFIAETVAAILRGKQ